MTDSYEKVPFVWNERQPLVEVPQRLTFRPLNDTPESDVVQLLSQIMEHSLDAGDLRTIETHGPSRAASNFLSEVEDGFAYEPEWWQVALNQDGDIVGLVLPVLFLGGAKEQLEEGTIYYMGVLPDYRGHRYGYDLLCQATRTLQSVGVWRIFCDTDTQNGPMIDAFGKVGYVQAGAPCKRPL